MVDEVVVVAPCLVEEGQEGLEVPEDQEVHLKELQEDVALSLLVDVGLVGQVVLEALDHLMEADLVAKEVLHA